MGDYFHWRIFLFEYVARSQLVGESIALIFHELDDRIAAVPAFRNIFAFSGDRRDLVSGKLQFHYAREDRQGVAFLENLFLIKKH